MAHERYTRTNQKLFFAGLSLENWRKADALGTLNAQGQVQAEREASLFHLYGAVLGLCHEIAGFYRSQGANAPRAEAFLNRQALVQAPSQELAELVELAEQPDTWLARLLSAHAALFQPPQAPTKAKVDPRQPLIEAVTLEEDQPEALSRTELELWRTNIKELVLRFRETMTEW